MSFFVTDTGVICAYTEKGPFKLELSDGSMIGLSDIGKRGLLCANEIQALVLADAIEQHPELSLQQAANICEGLWFHSSLEAIFTHIGGARARQFSIEQLASTDPDSFRKDTDQWAQEHDFESWASRKIADAAIREQARLVSPAFTLPHPADLPQSTLVECLRNMQKALWIDEETNKVDPDREWNADTWEHVYEILEMAELIPQEEC